MDDLTFVKEVSAKQVLDIWVEREGKNPAWQHSATEKGYDSVREWRKTYLEQFRLHKLAWNEYRINNPRDFVPNIYCGSYPSWQKYYSNRDQSQFKHIAPKLESNHRVQEYIAQGFDNQIQLIGLKYKQKYMLLEGHHTACAYTLVPQLANFNFFICDLSNQKTLFEHIFHGGIKSFTKSEWLTFKQNSSC